MTIPGPLKGYCPCGDPRCGRFGTIRTKVMQDGLRHVSRCPCRRCQGARPGKNEYRRVTKIAQELGGRRNIGSGAFGGNDTIGCLCAIEETANVSLVRGLRRWFESAQIQRKLAGLYSDNSKPRAFIASWNGKPQLVVQTYEDFRWHDEMIRGRGA